MKLCGDQGVQFRKCWKYYFKVSVVTLKPNKVFGIYFLGLVKTWFLSYSFASSPWRIPCYGVTCTSYLVLLVLTLATYEFGTVEITHHCSIMAEEGKIFQAYFCQGELDKGLVLKPLLKSLGWEYSLSFWKRHKCPDIQPMLTTNP